MTHRVAATYSYRLQRLIYACGPLAATNHGIAAVQYWHPEASIQKLFTSFDLASISEASIYAPAALSTSTQPDKFFQYRKAAMDPASIVAAATTAANGAWEIYSFCNDAKHINEAVRSLAKEAQAIRDVCEIVAKRLGSIVEEKDATELPGDKMRDLLGSQISDCQSTIAQIHASLQGLDKGSLNFLEKMKNQLRLNARAAGIAEARRQLRSYTDNLHLVLQVLSM